MTITQNACATNVAGGTNLWGEGHDWANNLTTSDPE